jgi:hypothetical protein
MGYGGGGQLEVKRISNDGVGDRQAIQAGMKAAAPRIRQCYENALVTDPNLQGKVTVRFTIEGDGSVSRAVASGMPAIDGCVQAIVLAIRFNRPAGSAAIHVNYPFVFNHQ